MKSVITCDLEGRIETYNEGAEALFGWTPEEVIGRKRVSLFSPGLVVLGHVGGWLAAARETGEFAGRTVFERKDGTRFAAQITIRPTKKNGAQIGYVGITEALPEVDPAEAMPPISFGTRLLRWMVVTRAPFLTATLVPIVFAAAWTALRHAPAPFPWGAFALALVGGLALHAAANIFNDYFDWTSGTDEANAEYFSPFSGGSRAVELRLVSARGLLLTGIGASLVALAAGIALAAMRGPGILWFGVVGLASAWFYTAPPLRLAARRGLGELFIGLNFGPLMVAGTVYALTGRVGVADLLMGLPLGLLTTAIVWVNEFPDAPSDARMGKRHLVVVLGKRAARWGYVALLVGAAGFLGASVALGWLPLGALLGLLALPFAVRAVRTIFRHYDDRELVRASAATIQLQLVGGLLMTAGILLSL